MDSKLPCLTITNHKGNNDVNTIETCDGIDEESYIKLFKEGHVFGSIGGKMYVETNGLLKQTLECAFNDAFDRVGDTSTKHGTFNFFVRLDINFKNSLIDYFKMLSPKIRSDIKFTRHGLNSIPIGGRVSSYSSNDDKQHRLWAEESRITLHAAKVGLHPSVFACGLKGNMLMYIVEAGVEDLESWSKRIQTPDVETMKNVASSLWSQMEAAAQFGLLMIDIKTPNIIVDSQNAVKFVDLGTYSTVLFKEVDEHMEACILFVNCVLLLNYVHIHNSESIELLKEELAFVKEYYNNQSDKAELCELFVTLELDHINKLSEETMPGDHNATSLAQRILYVAKHYATPKNKKVELLGGITPAFESYINNSIFKG